MFSIQKVRALKSWARVERCLAFTVADAGRRSFRDVDDKKTGKKVSFRFTVLTHIRASDVLLQRP